MNKKIIIILGVIVFIAVVAMYIYSVSRENKPTDVPNTIVPTPTVTPVKEASGGSLEGFQKAIENRPEYLIEARLRTEVPIQKDEFKITYDYAQAKFIVTFTSKNASARSSFSAWAKEQNLSDLSNFIIK